MKIELERLGDQIAELSAHLDAATPRLAQALSRGELSYSKVRALTRVATPETEERLLAVGRAGTAEHVERIVRGWRRVDQKAEAMESAKRHAGRALHLYQDEDGPRSAVSRSRGNVSGRRLGCTPKVRHE